MVKRPENQLTGMGLLRGGYHRSHGRFMDGSVHSRFVVPMIVFAGTGLKRGVKFGSADTIVGCECDGCQIEWREEAPYATGTDSTPANL